MILFMAGVKIFFGPVISKSLFQGQVCKWYPLFLSALKAQLVIIILDLQIWLHPELSGSFLTDSSSQYLFLRHQI